MELQQEFSAQSRAARIFKVTGVDGFDVGRHSS
jgi:hypothetical protein